MGTRSASPSRKLFLVFQEGASRTLNLEKSVVDCRNAVEHVRVVDEFS